MTSIARSNILLVPIPGGGTEGNREVHCSAHLSHASSFFAESHAAQTPGGIRRSLGRLPGCRADTKLGHLGG